LVENVVFSNWFSYSGNFCPFAEKFPSSVDLNKSDAIFVLEIITVVWPLQETFFVSARAFFNKCAKE